MPDQKTMWTRCLGGFSVMWVTKLLISPVKKRIFCPKTTKFGPKLAFLVNLGQAMQAYSVPCWWVGWWLWRAGCISQDTYLLYLGLGSLVGLGSFAVRPGSCPFFRQIKRKGITLSFNWGWSFTNSGLGLDSGSQILLCRGPWLYKLISVPQPGTLGQGWSPQKRVNRDEWDQR